MSGAPSQIATGPIGFQTMSSALPDAANYHRWILDLILPWVEGRTIEVGVGYGQYTRQIAARASASALLDVDPACLARWQTELPRAELFVADLQDQCLPDRLGRASFQTIVCLNVLEHLEDDRLALQNFYSALKPGGKLLLLLPAHPALYGAMDRLAGHYRRYRRRSFQTLLSSVGFQSPVLSYLNPLGGLGWWVNARFSKASSLSDPNINRQILLYDRYVQPMSRLLSPFFARFFGQSLWVVAKRPSLTSGNGA